MISKFRGTICIFGKYMKNNVPLILRPIDFPSDNVQPVRSIAKHYDPKFRDERRKKLFRSPYLKKVLENKKTEEEELKTDVYRSKLKEFGLNPQKEWSERYPYMASTYSILEAYVVPEGDGKFSAISKKGATQKLQFLGKKTTSYIAIKKIQTLDDLFHVKTFPDQALTIYKKAHEALAAKDTDTLLQYITETAYPQMTANLMDKTVHWEFLQSLEPARIVHARQTHLITKDNIYGQVTVRFHTQQKLCIYDRFGRLLQGSEILKKDVLEYIVFEKHVSNVYGSWRIHGKIVPDWMVIENSAEKTNVLSSQVKSTTIDAL